MVGENLFRGRVRPLSEVLELCGNSGKGEIEGRVKGSEIQVGPTPTCIMQSLT